MTRKEALDSIKANVENENLVKHMLATEAIKGIAAFNAHRKDLAGLHKMAICYIMIQIESPKAQYKAGCCSSYTGMITSQPTLMSATLT